MSNAEKIAQLRAEAAALEAADKAFDVLPEEYKLAITLHSLLCHWNHTDGCSWEYEKYEGPNKDINWNGHAHAEYLRKSRKILSFCNCNKISPEDAIKILEISKEF